MGVKDVLIFDPQLQEVYHHRRDGKKRLASPVRLELECGCGCEMGVSQFWAKSGP